MSSFNQFTGMGNLTRDPEIRYLDSGTAVVNFAIAMNRKWKDDNDETKEEVTFLECQAWVGLAETIAEYFRQGDPILVSGRLKTESWEDKDTDKKRSKIVLVVVSFSFCGDVSGGKSKKSKGKHRDEDRDEDRDKDRGGKKSSRDKDERKSKKSNPDDDDDVPF